MKKACVAWTQAFLSGQIILKRFLVENEDASRILLSVLKEYTKRHRIRPGKSHLLPHNQAEATLKPKTAFHILTYV